MALKSLSIILCYILFNHLHSILSQSCDIHGVSPSDCTKYAPSEKFFFCGGSKDKKIPMKYVNDDYCDCVETGDDEPGTSACNHGKFWCNNEGYRGQYIYSSLVNDGICDCCDGSDESQNSRIQCPNICASKAKEELSVFIQQKKKYMEGIKVKNSLLQVAKSKLNEKRNKKQQIESELNQKRQELTSKESIKNEAEQKEREYKEEQQRKKQEEKRKQCESEGGDNCDAAEVDGLGKEEINEQDSEINDGETAREKSRRERRERFEQRSARNRERREKRRKAREAALEKEREIESEVETEAHHEHTPDEEFPYPEQYRPHDDGEEDKEQHIEHTPDEEFPYPEQYRPHGDEAEEEGSDKGDDSGFDWSEFDEEEDEDELDGYIPPIDEEQEVEEVDPVLDELGNVVRDARNEYNNVNREIRNLESDLSEVEKVLDMDFGDRNIYASLFDECYSTKIGKYDYEFCPFGKAAQKEGKSSTNLGEFKSLKYNEKGELIMMFEDGTKCWNGPKRSAQVLFRCDTENEIVAVTEPSTCKYHMTFQTPLACQQEEVDRLNDLIQNQFKTEL